jgi:membrane-associated phospholipid phosphatase
LRIAFWITAALTFVLWSVFAYNPSIDMEVAKYFFRDGAFMGESAEAKAVRGFFYGFPIVVCVAFPIARSLKLPAALIPQSRTIIFVTLSMALGPGLLVNLIFKDHWHRPRPSQVQEFGGPWEFRPIGVRDGQCEKNCSFVSGETSSAFWLVGPASLAPPPWRVPAVAAALGVGVATGLLRMAFGGHFLSDVIFGALFTLLLVILMRSMIYPELRPGAGK